jgi:hypothetical protein
MQSSGFLPCAELRGVLLSAYKPCHGFCSTCKSMQWKPARGYVPRGFCGALGNLSEVELVLIVAEPGDPLKGETYPVDSPEAALEAVCEYVYVCFDSHKDQYHKNIRYILDHCWPKLAFSEQMRRTWITESTLCSAEKECGPVPTAVSQYCVESYLRQQLSLLPHATIVTLGGKAKRRTIDLQHALGHEFIPAWAAAPPGCNHPKARPSWDRIADEVRKRPQTGAGFPAV